MFLCGNSHRREEDDDIDSWSPCSTPKRSKRCGSYKNKNPFANRGLDKFYALLAELEDKKQKIYTQKGADDISLVQFVISTNNEIKPVVVSRRFKESRKHTTTTEAAAADATLKPKHVSPRLSHENINRVVVQQQSSPLTTVNIDQKRCKEKKLFFKLENLKKPSYYLAMVMILILLFLAIFGRSFAILCTSIGWYIIPSIKGGDQSSSSTRQKRKKDSTRRSSILSNKNQFVNNDNGLSSPRGVITGPVDKSPRIQHAPKKSC